MEAELIDDVTGRLFVIWKIWFYLYTDHIFPRNAEFWAELRNLPISAEFLFSWNFAEFGTSQWCRRQIWPIMVEFRPPYCMHTWFHHEIHDCRSSSDGRNSENIEL